MYLMSVIRYHKKDVIFNQRFAKYSVIEWAIIGVFIYFFSPRTVNVGATINFIDVGGYP